MGEFDQKITLSVGMANNLATNLRMILAATEIARTINSYVLKDKVEEIYQNSVELVKLLKDIKETTVKVP